MKYSRRNLTLCLSMICMLILSGLSPLSTLGRNLGSAVDSHQKANSPATLTAKVSDFDGDGRADLAYFLPPFIWMVRYTNSPAQPACTWTPAFGLSGFDYPFPNPPLLGPLPIPGDYSNDGRTDLALYESLPTSTLFTPSKFTISENNPTPLNGVVPGTFLFNYGYTSDTPIMGDFNGGGADFTVVRAIGPPLYWYTVDRMAPNNAIISGKQWGVSADYLVPGDYDGDGKTDMTIWRPSTGEWWTLTSLSGFVNTLYVQWGTSGDIPLLGDFDGDLKDDRAVYRPSNGVWYVLNSSTGAVVVTYWGTTGDIPVPADYNGDGKTDVAVYRPSDTTWYTLPCPPQKFVPPQGSIPIPSVYVRHT